jgi:hypothetical protein
MQNQPISPNSGKTHGLPILCGTITLLGGTEIRLKLVAPRAKKEKVA